MPDFNDVVRHVILRILVDQAGLAGELAAARAKLKELEKSEHDSNTNRAKDFDRVTERIDKQTEAVNRNAQANADQSKHASAGAKGVAEDWQKATKATEASTQASLNQARIQRDNDRSRANTLAQNARAQEKLETQLADLRHKNADSAFLRERTQNQRLLQDLEAIAAARAQSGYDTDFHASRASKESYNSDAAASRADTANSRSRDADDATERNIASRRAKSLNDVKRSRLELNNLAARGTILEQQALAVAERRAMAEERFARTRRRGLAGGVQAVGAGLNDVATGIARAGLSAPSSFRRGVREYDQTPELRTLSNSMGDLRKQATDGERFIASFFGVFRRDSTSALTSTSRLRAAFKSYVSDVKTLSGQANPFAGFARGVSEATGLFGKARAGVSGFFSTAKKDAADGERAVRGFFGRFRTDSDSAVRQVQRLSAGFKAFVADISRSRQGGSGGNLFQSFTNNAATALVSLGTVFDGMGKHFLSFQTLIVAVIGALGPLAAILGAVGAAGLGLASNLVALSGSLLALPGLIGAAVSAFGVLALVMKPLTNVFSAYTAASKAAAKGSVEGSKAAATAANALVDAQARAVSAERGLIEARKQAARGIQDYSLALQRLKFDKEGADLGAKSALREYRRTLADPTASTLDKQIARHAYEGSLNDKQDQAIQAGRTQQDAAEAQKKGVEGSDAVVAALAEQAHALQALAEAQKDAAAGGSANRTAQEALQAELDKLGPKTRKVVVSIHDLAGEYRDLVKRLSDKVFGPLSADTGKFKDVLKELENFLTPTATSLGKLADQALRLFTNPDWKRFFSTQGAESGKIIQKLGGALLDAADGFRGIVETSRPFVTFIVDGITGIAKSFDKFTTSKDGRKAIADFLKNTQKRMSELKPVIVDLFQGFAGFFAALNTAGGGKDDFTTYLNKGLKGAAAAFKELGDKARDPNGGFQTWLRNVRPVLHTVVGFLESAGRFFGKLFSDPANLKEASSLLESISSKWLPKLADIFDELSKSGLISKLANGIGKIFGALEKFLDNGGVEAVGHFANSVGTALGFVSGLVSALSGIPGVLKVIGITLATVFGVAFFTKFTGINAAIAGIAKAIRGYVNLRNSIKNPLNDPANDPTHPDHPNNKNKPSTTINPGTVGPVGPDAKKPKKPKKPAKPGGKPGIVGKILNAVTGSPNVGDITSAAKGAALGDNSVSSILQRSERHLHQIEINTRGYGRGNGSGGVDVDPDDPNKPRKDGKNRESTTDRDENGRHRNNRGGRGGRGGRAGLGAVLGGELLDDITNTNAHVDPFGPRGAGKGVRAGGISPRDPLDFSIGDTTRVAGATFARRQAADEARERAQRDAARDARNSPAGRQARLDAVADAEARRRNGATVPRFDLDTPADRRARTTEPAEVDQQPNNRRSATTETGAQKRKRLARERAEARNTRLNTPRPVTVDTPDLPDTPEPVKTPKRTTQPQVPDRPTDISGSPLADVGDDRTPYTRVGHNEAYHVPTAAETGGKLPAPSRGPGGRIVSPYTGEPGLGFPEPNFPGQQVPATETPRRNAQTRNTQGRFGPRREPTPVGSGTPSRPVLADVGQDPARPSRLRRFGQVLQGDSGSFGNFGLFGDDTRAGGTTARRGLTSPDERPSARPGRAIAGEARQAGRRGLSGLLGGAERVGGRGLLGRVGGGLLRGAAGGIGGLVAGAAASLGGDYLINKFVKNDDDASSLQRGLGAVANGAGIGATIGSIIPGVGTVIGGAVGGLAGGAYSLFKDKNLRNFLGDKLGGVGKSVGGFFGGAGSAIKGLFGGGGGDDKPGGGFNIKGLLGGAALGPLGALLGGTGIGGKILDSLKKASGGITGFFTKTIPHAFETTTKGISNFFTKTLPGLPNKGFKAIAFGLGFAFTFLTERLPRLIGQLFTETIPHAAASAWHFVVANLWDPFIGFIKAVPGFFTQTIPKWFDAVNGWLETKVRAPLKKFVTETVPNFFTETIPHWFEAAPAWFTQHVIDPVTGFFTKTLPKFFTETLPNAIKQLPGFLYDNLVQPILSFFTGIKDHVGDFLKGSWNWAKSVFSGIGDAFGSGEKAGTGKMSGGLIEGIYQGIEDKTRIPVTPGEFVVRRSKVQQTDGKRFLSDYNEGRINPSDFYNGLAATTAAPVMSIVPPSARVSAAAVATVVNNTINHAPIMGDVTIHNPVREASERSLRRQVEIAAIRHRR